MNEILIKLKSMLTGSGLKDTEDQLKRVKVAADDARRSAEKVGSTPAARPAPAPAQSGPTPGGSGGGGFLGNVVRYGGMVTGAIAVGKLASAQVEKLSDGVQATTEHLGRFSRAFSEAANAMTVDAAISGFEQLKGQADAVSEKLKNLRQDWGAWTFNLLTGGETFRQMAAAAESMRTGADSALVGAIARQADTAAKIAEDPTNKDRTKDLEKEAKRSAEMEGLIDLRNRAKSPGERLMRQNAIDLLEERNASEDAAQKTMRDARDGVVSPTSAASWDTSEQDRARAAYQTVLDKRKALDLELQIAEATRAGNTEEANRLRWIQKYKEVLESTQGDEGLARRAADAAMPDLPVYGPEAPSYADKAAQMDADRAAAVAASRRSQQAADMELEGKLAASKPGAGRRQLQWLKDYKTALAQLSEGLTPGSSEWDAAVTKSAQIADNLARAASNQQKLNDSAAPDSPDYTRGDAGRISADKAESERRAQTYEAFGNFGSAERERKKGEKKAEKDAAAADARMKKREAGEADKSDPASDWEKLNRKPMPEWLKRQKGLTDQKAPPGVDRPAAADVRSADALAASGLTASAGALNTAAGALSAAAAALQNVGRYQ